MSELGGFTNPLSLAIAKELEIQQSNLSSENMRVFDLGCFPWHGYLELSFLTDNEPQLNERSPLGVIGGWRLYNFVSKWHATMGLGAQMQRDWELAPSSDLKARVTERYLKACAFAMLSTEVSSRLSHYRLAPDFQLRVVDPDDPNSRNYCLPTKVQHVAAQPGDQADSS
jgi:hypothetical protein